MRPALAELPGKLVRVIAEVEAEERREGDHADHHQQRRPRSAQPAGSLENRAECGPQRLVHESARSRIAACTLRSADWVVASATKQQGQRQQESRVDPEVLEQRLRHRPRQQASLPERVEHERHPGDRDRDRDAPPESEASLPRDQSERLLGAVQRVVGEEREVLGFVGGSALTLVIVPWPFSSVAQEPATIRALRSAIPSHP